MKLTYLLEDFGDIAAYHITTAEALPSIRANGLRSGMTPRYGHVGEGIYVFFGKESRILDIATNMVEYLGVEEPILIETRVSPSSLLMDEDSLADGDTQDAISYAYSEGRYVRTQEILDYFPAEFFEEYLAAMDQPWSVPTKVEDDRKAALQLINKYNIKPTAMFPSQMGHYTFQTARCTANRLPVVRLWQWDNEEGFVLFRAA
jgi:hypothetical protein